MDRWIDSCDADQFSKVLLHYPLDMLNLWGQGHFLNAWVTRLRYQSLSPIVCFLLKENLVALAGRRLTCLWGSRLQDASWVIPMLHFRYWHWLRMTAQLETLLFRMSLLKPVTDTEQFSLVGDYALTIRNSDLANMYLLDRHMPLFSNYFFALSKCFGFFVSSLVWYLLPTLSTWYCFSVWAKYWLLISYFSMFLLFLRNCSL